jgi:hypothetical protein
VKPAAMKSFGLSSLNPVIAALGVSTTDLVCTQVLSTRHVVVGQAPALVVNVTSKGVGESVAFIRSCCVSGHFLMHSLGETCISFPCCPADLKPSTTVRKSEPLLRRFALYLVLQPSVVVLVPVPVAFQIPWFHRYRHSVLTQLPSAVAQELHHCHCTYICICNTYITVHSTTQETEMNGQCNLRAMNQQPSSVVDG